MFQQNFLCTIIENVGKGLQSQAYGGYKALQDDDEIAEDMSLSGQPSTSSADQNIKQVNM